MGCSPKVTIGVDGECSDPKPEVPPGTWCPPAYECIDGEWVDTAGACPEPTCPADMPAEGAACEMLGQTCAYESDEPCGDYSEVSALCTETGWVLTKLFCSPGPVCPEALPEVGGDCSEWSEAYFCNYNVETPCGAEWTDVYCDTAAEIPTWTLENGLTCDNCRDFSSVEACSASASCQWLWPGCGEAPIVVGCYPKEGCDVLGCEESWACSEVSYDPCYNKECDGCSAAYMTCLPVLGP